MHSIALVSLTILTNLLQAPILTAAEAHPEPQYRPFLDPYLDINELQKRDPLRFHKRASCGNNYSPCSDLGNPNVCCPPDTTCTTDNAANIACCTLGEVCSGTLGYTLPAGGATNTVSGIVFGTSTTTTQPITITSSAGIPNTGVAGGGSTVSNDYYPYVYIPTSYANADLCTSAWSNCQSQSTACFNQLAGNGVTIGGPAGGTTQAGLTATIAVAASSICSSLSNVACYNIAETQCTIFGNGVAPSTVGMGARPTACVGGAYVAAMGAAGVAAIW